jgi:hypothetical protein
MLVNQYNLSESMKVINIRDMICHNLILNTIFLGLSNEMERKREKRIPKERPKTTELIMLQAPFD